METLSINKDGKLVITSSRGHEHQVHAIKENMFGQLYFSIFNPKT